MPHDASSAKPPERHQLLHTGVGMASFQAFSFFAGLFVASGLGPEGQGRFQLLVSTCVCLTLFCKLGLDEGLAYVIPRFQLNQPTKVRAVVVYALGSTTILSVIFGVALRLVSQPLARSVFELPAFATDLEIAPLMLPALILLMMSNSVLRGLGRSDLRAYAYYGPAGLGFLLMVVFFYSGGLRLEDAYIARIGSYLIGAVTGLALIVWLVRDGTWVLARSEIRQLHSFAGWLVFVGLFEYLVFNPLVDLTIVSHYGSPSDVGVYSVAARIASLPGLVSAASVIVLAPMFSRAFSEASDASTARYRTSSTRMAHLTVLASALVFFLGDHVLAAVGPEYEVGAPQLRAILAGYLLTGILGLNAPVLLAAGYTRLEFALSGLSLALLMIAGIFLAQWFGPFGVAVATGTALGVLALLRLLFCFRLVMHTPPRWLLEVAGFGAVASAVCLFVRTGVGVGGLLGSLMDALTFCGAYGALIGLRYRASS